MRDSNPQPADSALPAVAVLADVISVSSRLPPVYVPPSDLPADHGWARCEVGNASVDRTELVRACAEAILHPLATS